MQVSYELTRKDFYEAFVAARNRSSYTKWGLRILVTIVFVFAGGGLVLLIARPDSQVLPNLVPVFFLAFLWILVMWGAPWWAARSQFSKQPAVHGERTVLLDGGGIHWRWNQGSADMQWSNFIRFQETKNHFLFYTSPASFNVVPKRSLVPEELEIFRKLVTENIPPAPRSQSSSLRTWIFLAVVVMAGVLLVMAIHKIRIDRVPQRKIAPRLFLRSEAPLGGRWTPATHNPTRTL